MLRTYGSLSLATCTRRGWGGLAAWVRGGPEPRPAGQKPRARARARRDCRKGGTAWRLDPDSDAVPGRSLRPGQSETAVTGHAHVAALVPAQSLPLRPPACVPFLARARGQKPQPPLSIHQRMCRAPLNFTTTRCRARSMQYRGGVQRTMLHATGTTSMCVCSAAAIKHVRPRERSIETETRARRWHTFCVLRGAGRRRWPVGHCY